MRILPSKSGRWTRTGRVVAPLALSVIAAVTAAACGAKTGLGFDSSSNQGSGGSGGTGGIVFGTTGDTGGSGGLGTGGFGTGGLLGTGGTGGMIPPPAACADAGQTFIYVVTDTNDLYAFDPNTNGFAPRGNIACLPAGAESMAVDRLGHAYVESNDGQLRLVNLNDASCTDTTFVGNAGRLFGMSFVADRSGDQDTLFIAYRDGELDTVDLDTFTTNTVGTFDKDIGSTELTGTGDGRLFAFGVFSGADSDLARIDRNTAEVLAVVKLPIQRNNSWAFAWWGGIFYFFTDNTVHRYDPESNQPPTQVATSPGNVVGAGVSTCAPLN
jgi:hypothetical protein